MARASEQLFFRGQQQVSPLNMYTRRIGTWRHYGAGRAPPTVMEELMQRAGPELERLEELIDRCEEEIRACILQIVQVESKLSEDMNTKDEVYWRKKEEQLRKKEEQLRKKEEQLREEKALLIGRPAQPDAKFDTDMCLFIEAATRMNLDGSDSDVGMHAFETVDGTRLTLPGDAEVNLFDGQLFVRDCYPPLLRQILAVPYLKHSTSGLRQPLGYFLTGTPGIGKSAFSIYVVAVLLAQKRTVLYQKADKQGFMLHWDGKRVQAYRYVQPAVNSEWSWLVSDCREEGAWYVIDSIEPLDCGLPTLLVSSPDPAVSKEWVKQRKAAERWMPLPTEEDLRQLREHVNPLLSDEELAARQQLAGKSARLVLSHQVTIAGLETSISEAMGEMPLSIFERGLRMRDSSRKLSHRLVHHDVHRPRDSEAWKFDTYHLRFASNEVGRQIVERVAEDRGHTLWRLANMGSAWRLMPTARGTVFQALVLGKLARGETMHVRRLGYDEETRSVFSHTGERTFSTLDSVQLHDEALWLPQSSHFESIDALSHHGLFQITAAKRHPVKREGLAVAAAFWHSQMGYGRPAPLILIIPKEMCDLYTAPQPITPAKAPKVDHVQYVGWFADEQDGGSLGATMGLPSKPT